MCFGLWWKAESGGPHEQATRDRVRHCCHSEDRESSLYASLTTRCAFFLQTLDWARDLFKAQVAPDRPDEVIQLGFVSLLIAIEDAAAAEILHEKNPCLMDQAVLRYIRQQGLEKQIGPDDLFELSEAPVLG